MKVVILLVLVSKVTSIHAVFRPNGKMIFDDFLKKDSTYIFMIQEVYDAA